MKSNFSIQKLDVAEFARQGAELKGDFTFDRLSRLTELCFTPLPRELTGQKTIGRWQVNGELVKNRMGDTQIWLHLFTEVKVPMRCERCLKPIDIAVGVKRSFRFVPTEEQAIAEDAESAEDVLALTKALNVLDLCEDELILALPLMPLHEVCAEPLVPGLDHSGLAFEVEPDDGLISATQENPNPFAALKALKKNLH